MLFSSQNQIGINPGLFAAYRGHHYAGPGNHFWKCLYLSGLTHEQMNAEEDFKLLDYGIGFTNMVQRATKGSADLTRKEIKEGSHLLHEKLRRYRPKIAVFNGKLIFEVFSGRKEFNFGRQPECVEGTNTVIICNDLFFSNKLLQIFFCSTDKNENLSKTICIEYFAIECFVAVYVGDAIIQCEVCAITASSR